MIRRRSCSPPTTISPPICRPAAEFSVRHDQPRPRCLLAAGVRVPCGAVRRCHGGLHGGRHRHHRRAARGLFRRHRRLLLMRITDIAFGIPFLPFVIVLSAFLEPSIWNVVLAMALSCGATRRASSAARCLPCERALHVEAARVAGASASGASCSRTWRRISCRSPFLYGSVAIGWAILTEASVSFLGFGDASTISAGATCCRTPIAVAGPSRGSFHWFVPPGICIVPRGLRRLLHRARL